MSRALKLAKERQKTMSPNNGGGGRIAVPGQVNISLDKIDAPFATPVQFTLQGPGSLQAKVFGGFSKLEMATLYIGGHYKDIAAEDVVRRAQELLAACAAADKESQHGEDQGRSGPGQSPQVRDTESPA